MTTVQNLLFITCFMDEKRKTYNNYVQLFLLNGCSFKINNIISPRPQEIQNLSYQNSFGLDFPV